MTQSLFTCEYIHHLPHLEQHSDYSNPNNVVKYFHGFCNGILLLKTKLEYVMARTSCRESEEFSYDSCGFPEVQLMDSETKVMERFDNFETELSNRLSFLSGKQATQSFEPFQEDKLVEETITNALLSRISFIKVCAACNLFCVIGHNHFHITEILITNNFKNIEFHSRSFKSKLCYISTSE